MSDRRDIEPVLDRWLDKGPTVVPPPLFDATMAQLGRRRPQLDWRTTLAGLTSPRLVSGLALAVAAVALALGSGLFGSVAGPGGIAPTSAPTASPEASAPAGSDADPTERPYACIGGPCAGVLSTGTYSTARYEHLFSYSVPDGWENVIDDEAGYVLLRDDLPGDQPGEAPFFFGAFVDPVAKQTSGCFGVGSGPIGRSADQLAAWLAGRDEVTTTEPAPVTVGGLDGKVIEVLRDASAAGCFGETPLFSVPRFGSASGQVLSIEDGELHRYYFLDDGERTLMILARVPTAPSALVPLAEVQGIVDSIRFAAQ